MHTTFSCGDWAARIPALLLGEVSDAAIFKLILKHGMRVKHRVTGHILRVHPGDEKRMNEVLQEIQYFSRKG